MSEESPRTLTGVSVRERDFTPRELAFARLLAERLDGRAWTDQAAYSKEQRLVWLVHARHFLAHLRDGL